MIAAATDWTAIIVMFVTLTVSLTVHEAAHALFAMLGGDQTAYRGGQVTLNPLPHMRREPFGMVILPVLALVMTNGRSCFGFASAPVDPVWAYHHPRKAALMSAAGPLANVLLAAIAFTVLWFLGRPTSNEAAAVHDIAMTFLQLNLLLAVFNFVPLPPLDGAGIVAGLVPAARRFYDGLARIPNFGMLVILALFYLFPRLFEPILIAVLRLLPR